MSGFNDIPSDPGYDEIVALHLPQPRYERRPMRTCPRCGEQFDEYPALSRLGNESLICAACGNDEAMRDLNGQLEEKSSWPVVRVYELR